MNVKIDRVLEQRLRLIAQKREQSLSKLVEDALPVYVGSLEGESPEWVASTQRNLPKVWPVEDFSDWNPPRGR